MSTRNKVRNKIIWCQVLSPVAHYNCHSNDCDNPMHLYRRIKRQKKPHSMPKEFWDRKRQRLRPTHGEEERAITESSRKWKAR